MDSILQSVKKLLGIAEEYEHFDQDIIIHINSAFSTLNQLGVGPSEGFSIEDDSAYWTDFINDNRLPHVKSYVFSKVRMLFDPPTTSIVAEALNKNIAELEWRLNVASEVKE